MFNHHGLDSPPVIMQPDFAIDGRYRDSFDTGNSISTMAGAISSDIGELMASPLNQTLNTYPEAIPVARWETNGPMQGKLGPKQDGPREYCYGSILSPPENLDDDLSPSEASPKSAYSDVVRMSNYDGSERSTQSTSSTQSTQVLANLDTSVEDTISAGNARSERARKAANHRHSTAKDRRRPSSGSNGDTNGSKTNEEVRRKNRIAATKCRRKKKENEEALEAIYRTMAAANKSSREAVRELRDELTVLRTLALDHMRDHDGCNCESIQQYNKQQAQMTALSVLAQPQRSSDAQMQGKEAPEGHF